MPIYEYECKKCKTRFEVLQKIKDDSIKVYCPKCGSVRSQKVFSTFSGKSAKTPACSPGNT